MSVKTVELFRDSSQTPWGFRLAGGKDLKQALHIQKVSTCSPAHGELEAGDILLEVQNYDAAELSHASAQDIIRKAGGSIKLRIRRCGFSQISHTPQAFRPQTWNQGSYMMSRLHNTLSGVVNNKSTFAANRARHNLTEWIGHNVPSPVKSTPEFGWSPRKNFSKNEMGTCFIPAHFSSKSAIKLSPQHLSNNYPAQFSLQQDFNPQYDFSESFQKPYKHVEDNQPRNLNPSNKQYNSPIGLYSQCNLSVPQAISPSIHTHENDHHHEHEEILYTHKVQD